MGSTDGLTVAGLFAGIGGIELGLQRAGCHSTMLCEVMPEARRVLEHHFEPEDWVEDIRALAETKSKKLPDVDVIAAGFPCQDLSQAGGTAGIEGKRSGLVNCLFELLDRRKTSPRWVLIENVPFMLQLDSGRAMEHLTEALEGMGFRWAYRIVDTRAFGIPHRRQRVVMLASRTEDPRAVLFADNAVAVERERSDDTFCGFYWTEGNRGLGWAVDAVPTLKGGSTVGIPSPPAVWIPDRDFVGTPTIEDAERLQGFPPGWTQPAVDDPTKRNGPRWKLVGNAVSVPLAEWIGGRLVSPGSFEAERAVKGLPGKWPRAAYGERGNFWSINVSDWPVAIEYTPLRDFLRHDLRELSDRATTGFVRRFEKSSLRKPAGFLDSLRRYLCAISEIDNGAPVSV